MRPRELAGAENHAVEMYTVGRRKNRLLMTNAVIRSDMRRILRNALPIVICAHSFCTIASDGQSRVSHPIVVLEGINAIHGFGEHQADRMLVRLTDDGKVQWDKWVGNTWKRQISSVSVERMSEIRRSLDTVDQSQLRAKMGPYHRYVDTSVELHIRMATSRGELVFSVLNPWWNDIPSKPIPKDMKTVVCEISRLHAQVAKESVDHMCETINAPQ